MQLKPKHLFPALIATCLFGTPGNAQTNTSQPIPSGTPEQTEIVQPPWEVCNETSFILKLATASVAQGMQGTPLSVQGWQTLRPGACQTMNVEKGTPRFVYAQSSNVHQGDIREWKGTHEYCVDAGDFTAKTDLSCALQNLTTKQFLRIIPTEHRTTFVEPDDFRKNAATAGIQRLLRDNNYEVSRIDGVSGRRTNNTLKKFISDKKLGSNLDDDAKFAALEEHAKIAMSDVGLNICNKSGRRVWTAIAFNNGEEMESRGWWSIDVDDCKRIYSKNLIKSDLHFYARQESAAAEDGSKDAVLKVSANDKKSFCVGEAQFSAIQQKYCRDQGYISVKFKTVSKALAGRDISLTDNDFASGGVIGLR